MKRCEYCGVPASPRLLEIRICDACLSFEEESQDQNIFLYETRFGLKSHFRKALKSWLTWTQDPGDPRKEQDLTSGFWGLTTPKERGNLFFFFAYLQDRVEKEKQGFVLAQPESFTFHYLNGWGIEKMDLDFSIDFLWKDRSGKYHLEVVFEDPSQDDPRIWKKILLQWVLASYVFPSLSSTVRVTEIENLRTWRLKISKKDVKIGVSLLHKRVPVYQQ